MDNGERVASLLAGCGWMTPLRVPFSLSLALALLRQPLPAEKEAGQQRDQVREALRRDLEAARYAAGRGNTTLPTRPTDW